MSKRWQVVGTMEICFDIEVEAEDEDEAEQKAMDMDFSTLIESAGMPRIDVDAVTELNPKRGKVGK
jgi:hypothetical protein